MPLGKGDEEGSQEKRMGNVANFTALLGAGCIASSVDTGSRAQKAFYIFICYFIKLGHLGTKRKWGGSR